MIDPRLCPRRRRAARAVAAPALAAPAIGQPAPAFTAVDADGKTRSLAEFKGKTVVLEWTNNGCPYVKRHYSAGTMQDTQRKATAQGAVWLTVASSPEGQQGHVTAAEAKAWRQPVQGRLERHPARSRTARWRAPTRPRPRRTCSSSIPRASVAYMGAIDDKPTDEGRRGQGREELRAGRASPT